MSRISSKAEMYSLYERGAFGNKLLTWPTLDEYLQSGFEGNIVLRYKGDAGGAWVAYDLPKNGVDEIVRQWVSEGAKRLLITVNESAPDSRLVLQGEVMRSTEYLTLRYSTLKKPMRVALGAGQSHSHGITAVLTLSTLMDSTSYENLWRLLYTYEDAIVEFSIWSMNVGTIEGCNTVFWEVRNY